MQVIEAPEEELLAPVPGARFAELPVSSIQPNPKQPRHVFDEEALEEYGQPGESRVLDPEDVATSVVHALVQPEHVAVNEILVEPRDEPV